MTITSDTCPRCGSPSMAYVSEWRIRQGTATPVEYGCLCGQRWWPAPLPLPLPFIDFDPDDLKPRLGRPRKDRRLKVSAA